MDHRVVVRVVDAQSASLRIEEEEEEGRSCCDRESDLNTIDTLFIHPVVHCLQSEHPYGGQVGADRVYGAV